mmetsp:Transcript_74635/g.235927  ORF Transcript_74635/g.235927 Transcript_74635/m.235927 type:complete len:326 (-) Transcript_74635:797-1774(-)
MVISPSSESLSTESLTTREPMSQATNLSSRGPGDVNSPMQLWDLRGGFGSCAIWSALATLPWPSWRSASISSFWCASKSLKISLNWLGSTSVAFWRISYLRKLSDDSNSLNCVDPSTASDPSSPARRASSRSRRVRNGRASALTTCAASSSSCSTLMYDSMSSVDGGTKCRLSSRLLPCFVRRRCGEPKHWKAPSTWMAIREQRDSASSGEWVARSTTLLRRSSAILCTSIHRVRRATGSMPAEGSSRKTSGGSPVHASAMDSLRLLPAPSCPPRQQAKAERPKRSSWCRTSSTSSWPKAPRRHAWSSRCSCTVNLANSGSPCGQ